MRINAYLARAGVASRRKVDQLIKAGRVSVNGQTAQLNDDITDQEVRLDNKVVKLNPPRYILLNKPKGYVTTLSDEQGRPTVIELVKTSERVVPVGRLDFNTSGLLILTNDGDLAHSLMHPSHQIVKTYRVRVRGEITERILDQLRRGVELADGLSTPAEVAQISENEIEIKIHQGRNRQVRRMIDAVGLKLLRLERTAYGPLCLDGLSPGEVRDLTAEEIDSLKRAVK